MPIIYGSSEIWGDLLVTGSFSILGSASTISTTNLVVSDTIITLGHSQSGTPILDEGIMFGRGTGLTQAFIWDESDDTFALVETNDDHTVIGDININSYSKLRVGGLTTSNLTISSSPNTGYLLTSSDNNGNTQWSPLLIGTTSIAGGSDGQIFFQSTGNKLGQDSNIFWNNTSKSLGIGTSSNLSYKLEVFGNTNFKTSTLTTTTTPQFVYLDGVSTPTDTSTIKSIYKEYRPTTTSSTVVVGDGTLLYPNLSSSSNALFNANAGVVLYTGDLSLLTSNESLTTNINVIQIQSSTGTYNGFVKSSSSVLRNITSGGVIDKYVGFWMNGFDGNFTHNGTTNKMYGFYMSDQSGKLGNITSTSSRWGIYVEDGGNNYFAGKVGIGINSPVASLDVRGNALFNGNGGLFDFTIQGNTASHLFYVDSSSDTVYIGSTSSSILPPGANVSNVVINKRVGSTTVGHFVEVDNGTGANVGYYSYLQPTGSILENYSYTAISDLSNSTISNNYGFYTLYQNGGTGSVNRGFYANINTTSLSNIGLDVNVYGSTYSNTGISIDVPANGTAIFTKQGNVIFNSLQGNSDLTIKGDNDANLFFADASSDYIGIGTSNPLYKLQVSGTVSTTGFRMTNGASNGYIMVSNADGVGSWTSSIRDLSFAHSGISPVISTTYHIGFIPSLQPSTTNQVSRRVRSPYRGEITSVSIMWSMSGGGSSENVIYQLHNLTQATSVVITSTAQLLTDSHNTFTLSSPLSISENDDLQIRWITPAWGTPPTSVNHVMTVRVRVY
jgi:hypothetical protein